MPVLTDAVVKGYGIQSNERKKALTLFKLEPDKGFSFFCTKTYISQQNNNLNKFEATVFLENFIANLLANELTTYIKCVIIF